MKANDTNPAPGERSQCGEFNAARGLRLPERHSSGPDGLRLSVLMPVCSKEVPESLRQSLESLCAQTLPADEVVLVEDGPLGEGLAEVIASFRARLPIVSVKLPVNEGLGIALRAGLDRCRGEFVARMDGDDISVRHRFERQIAFLEGHPEVDVVGGAIAEFDDGRSTPRAIRRLPASGAGLLKFAKHRNPLNHMTVMFRKAAVIAAGNYQPCPAFEDYHLWSRMLICGCRLHNLEDILVYARCGDGMQSRRGGLSYVRQEIRMQRLLREMGFLSRFECIRNIVVRTPLRLIPRRLRALAYRVLLRDSARSQPAWTMSPMRNTPCAKPSLDATPTVNRAPSTEAERGLRIEAI